MAKWMLGAAASVAALFIATLAAADKYDFVKCDGYGAPNSHGDGMTKPAMGLLGIFVPEPGRGNRSRTDVSFSADGTAACDRALVDPDLMPGYHLRRVNLIQARAMHRLGAKDPTGALSDLDLSARQGKASGEPLYERSLGLSNQLLRAYALGSLGRPADAVAAARRVRTLRPYAARACYAAARLAASIDHDASAYIAELREIVRFAPEMLTELLLAEYSSGHWDAVIALRPQVVLTPPSDNTGFQVERDGVAEAEIFAQAAMLDCATAFSHAAKGRPEVATAMLAAVKTRLDEAAADLPLRPNGKQPSRGDRLRHANLTARLAPVREAYDEALRHVGLLAIARRGDPPALMSAIAGKPLLGDETGQEVLMALYRANPPAKEELAKIIADRRLKLDAERFTPVKLEDLYVALPEAETPARLPHYSLGRNWLGEKTGDGFLIRKGGTPDRFTLDFGGSAGSAAIVQELALLRVADLARQQGKTSVIVVSRNLYVRESRLLGLYGGGRVDNAGYSSEITVALVKPSQIPVDLAASRDRLLDAERVYLELAPVYIGSVAPVAAGS
ncbi:hypothetical protein GGQ80_001112 [Sphingomonas jinjuensis]|uniref:Uncharacterized protein n=1 Tax=Sphingomonas jinjuensis TaxID=535907 RepID=A0A840FBR8_9SPHN|nr:hypothetical protein [Sphingomonas jinjuensis]MBB4153224.1 hypothetical protein [Sphingomonas jinjuensis]